mgnify:CR=1 FL=1
MTADIVGENKWKVIQSLRSEVATQRVLQQQMESNRKIPIERQQQLIDLLRSEITVVRNIISLLIPLEEKKEYDGE